MVGNLGRSNGFEDWAGAAFHDAVDGYGAFLSVVLFSQVDVAEVFELLEEFIDGPMGGGFDSVNAAQEVSDLFRSLAASQVAQNYRALL